MNYNTFILKGKEYILKEVEPGQTDFIIANGGLDTYLYSKIDGIKYMSPLPLPKYSYRIIGLTNDLTEEQCAELVEDNGWGCWDNYEGKIDERYTCTSAKDSFDCLLRSVNLNTICLLIEVINKKVIEPIRQEIPRRIRLDLNTTAELTIYNAMQEVEKLGADVKLADAVILLQKAKDLVADYIDKK